MKFDIVTLFPKMFESPFAESMIKRAIEKNLVKIEAHDMRKWAWNSYGAVDDKPYGGGVGMLVRVDVVDHALKEIKSKILNFKNGMDSHFGGNGKTRIILLSARGKRYTQEDAKRLSSYENIILICGHYEGFDERVSNLVDEEISIGDYVLTGGEIPAMVIVDSVTRLLPGVLGKDASSKEESHSTVGYIEYPQYTRPAEYSGEKVPEELLSGDPKKIDKFQRENSKNKSKNSKL